MKQVASKLVRALSEKGLALLVNHGIPECKVHDKRKRAEEGERGRGAGEGKENEGERKEKDSHLQNERDISEGSVCEGFL